MFGLVIFPVIFLCILGAFIGLQKGDIGTFLPAILLLTIGSLGTLLPIGIILTNDDLRNYSGNQIVFCFNMLLYLVKFLTNCMKQIFYCKCSDNQIHAIVE